MKQRFVLMALLFLACGVQPAVGQTCTLAISALNFGNYTSTLLNGTASGNVSNCPKKNNGWTIPLNAGTGAGANETTRMMTGPGGTLPYQLFMDPTRTANWGNTTGNDLAGNDDTPITVYGLIPAAQYATPGAYTDTISSATTHFTVNATIQATCTVSAMPLAFGTYAGALLSATSTISATCTKTTAYNIGLNGGGQASPTNRAMTGPLSSLLKYNLSSSSGLNWGNTVGTGAVSSTGSGAAQQLTVYGQVPAGQFVRPGNYTDTIIVTLTY